MRSPSIKCCAVAGGKQPGWLTFDEEIAKYPTEFDRPTGEEANDNDDIMLISLPPVLPVCLRWYSIISSILWDI